MFHSILSDIDCGVLVFCFLRQYPEQVYLGALRTGAGAMWPPSFICHTTLNEMNKRILTDIQFCDFIQLKYFLTKINK